MLEPTRFSIVLLDSRTRLKLGVAESRAVVSVPTPRPERGAAFPPRRLHVKGTAVFELNLWCGTCPCLVQRLSAADAVDLVAANDRLNAGLDSIDRSVLKAYSKLLPKSEYTPLLLDVTPRLVYAGDDADYFTHERVDTWGVDPLGDPADNVSPYYRTFETPTGRNGHLYELIIPMVPPSWNDSAQVQRYAAAGEVHTATAAAYSLLDVIAPAVDDGEDYYEHWVLRHFLLDGHHKVAAAARGGYAVRLLALVDNRVSLASADELKAIVTYRRQPRQVRRPGESDRRRSSGGS